MGNEPAEPTYALLGTGKRDLWLVSGRPMTAPAMVLTKRTGIRANYVQPNFASELMQTGGVTSQHPSRQPISEPVGAHVASKADEYNQRTASYENTRARMYASQVFG
jgi:hypothetical protein